LNVIDMCPRVLAVGWSFVSPRQALWAFALNIAAPWLARRGRK
jgi:hypothetical protein